MVQVCPFCKKTIDEEATACPHCNKELPTGNEWIQDKKQYYKRMNNLYVLGFTLLFSAVVFWQLQARGIITPNWVTGGLFAVIWVAGFAIFCIYLRKGDDNFAWIG